MKIITLFVGLLSSVSADLARENKSATILNRDNFDSIVYDRRNYVFVHFYSSKCEDCEDYSTVLDTLATQMSNRHNIVIAKIDLDKEDVDIESINEESFQHFVF